MKQFLQYQGSDIWWEWPDGGMTVYNMAGGHHNIDENSEAFMFSTVIRAESWADLCRKTGYNPWKVEKPRAKCGLALVELCMTAANGARTKSQQKQSSKRCLIKKCAFGMQETNLLD